MIPSSPPPQKKKNNSLIRLDKPENILENDQRNGFPVQGRSKTRGCESLALDPPLTSVYFRWPRLFPPFFPSLSPGFSRPSTPLFLPFFHRPKGRKPVLEHSTPSRPREPNRVLPRFIRLSRYTSVHLYETWWNETDDGGPWVGGVKVWVEEGNSAKGRERLITFY